MYSLIPLPFLCLALGLSAAAEMYRCADPEGKVHFVGDPSRCAGASAYMPDRTIVAAPPAAPALKSDAGGGKLASLEALLPDEGDIDAEWDVTREMGVTAVEGHQQRLGVVATQTRHYGRTREGVTEVCSIELWGFAEASQAEDAASLVRYPGWSFEARGAVLVTLRGTRFQRGKPFQKGLFPDCHGLARLVRVP